MLRKEMRHAHDGVFQSLRLSEWDTCEIEGVVLTDEDRLLAKELSVDPAKRLVIEELRDRTRIQSTSWIGVVRLHHLEIQVLPKLAGENLGVLEMIEQTRGLDSLSRPPSLRTLNTEGSNLYDLCALLLTEQCERILRGGILADYVEEEDSLPVLRGRLLVDRQLRQRFGQIDKVICRYDEYHQNIKENQILAFALDFCSRRVQHPSIARRTRQVSAIFREVCEWTNLDRERCWEDLFYHRMNEHYRPAHQLAKLLVYGGGVTNLYDKGSTNCFAFLIDMNLLFERFILHLLQVALDLQQVKILYQHRERSILWDTQYNRPYRKVIPDFLVAQLGEEDARLPIDAKYKLYDESKVQPADIYQMFLYAYAFSNPVYTPQAVLIFPSERSEGFSHCLEVRSLTGDPKASICVLGIHIPTFLAELKSGYSGIALKRLGRIITEHLQLSVRDRLESTV